MIHSYYFAISRPGNSLTTPWFMRVKMNGRKYGSLTHLSEIGEPFSPLHVTKFASCSKVDWNQTLYNVDTL